MFGNSFNVCAAVAENLIGAHNIREPETHLSYISLNSGELVFTSNQIKFQVLGVSSMKWNKEHFININDTAKKLVTEILEQIEEREREGKEIYSAEQWLADRAAFNSRKAEWNNGLWVGDIEKLEIEKWANFLETQENPIFQDLASFLNCHLNDGEEAESIEAKPHFRELLESEIDAANKLADFLANHSNDLLREGAEWIPQWVEARSLNQSSG